MRRQNRRKSKRETRARQERGWRQVARVVGAGLFDLPEFFRTGLYRLTRGGLPDAEIVRAYERCRAWLAKVKDGAGGMRMRLWDETSSGCREHTGAVDMALGPRQA